MLIYFWFRNVEIQRLCGLSNLTFVRFDKPKLYCGDWADINTYCTVWIKITWWVFSMSVSLLQHSSMSKNMHDLAPDNSTH